VDIEFFFPEAIHLTLDNWSYIQKVDYEYLPFKCKSCHEYGNFAKRKGNKRNGNNQKGRKQPEMLWLNNMKGIREVILLHHLLIIHDLQ
jgi:hypothetical protein